MKQQYLFTACALAFLCSCSPNKPLLDGDSQYLPFAPDGVEFVVADSAWTANQRGNHRAVVRVENIGHHHAASVTLRWRRPDMRPESKKVVVTDAQTDKEIKNVKVTNFSAEEATITFEPESGNGTYHIYYLPYTYRHGWDDARYGKPWNDYLPPVYQAEERWLNALKNNIEVLPAKLLRFESRSRFDAFTPMGLTATTHEMDSVKMLNKQNPILFSEDRAFPIRLTQSLPARWVKGEDRTNGFQGTALRGEYYTWQVGVWAAHAEVKNVRLEFSDLQQGTKVISKDSITCFNQEGTNWDGTHLQIPVHVGKNKVQAMWCGVQIPADATPGRYHGTIKVTSDGAEEQIIPIELNVKNEFLADKGDSDLWRHARLRWLNSTIGADLHTVTPFKEMQVDAHTITATDKTIKIGDNGLPTSIKVNEHEILAAPFKFVIHTTQGDIALDNLKTQVKKEAAGLVKIIAQNKLNDIEMSVTADAEFDGYIHYRIHLKPHTDLAVKDICMQTEYTPYTSTYFMGVGHSGGKRPHTYRWDWTGPWDSYWMGGANAGLHVEYRGGSYHGPLLNDYRPQAPQAWANQGKGEIKLHTTPQGGACLAAHTGIDTIPATGRYYEFALMITPTRPVNPAKHFSERYYHAAPSGFDAAATQGANIANIHHAQPLNPVINYPFIVQDSLKAFIKHEHQHGRKVKIYYTIRELTNYATEIYALKSLNHEILAPGVGYGLPWHCEHLIDDYKPAWYTELEGETSDAALVLSGFSRWINYYLEGLRWMFENYELDGIYMDDVSFDRPVMKRMRKIMEKYRPGALIDLHSNTTYSIGPANQYTGFFPYIDRLWFGEHFLYNEMTPDEWFVTFSGIPFGQMSEMLQDGGNRYLGMVYGSTARHSYGPFSPTPVWRLWDDFGIQDAKMCGYWNPECPVKCADPEVKVTAYIKKGSALLSVGNFASTNRKVKLQIDWKALGIDPAKAVLKAPAVEDFQEARTFECGEEIPVPSKKGWLLLLSEN